MVRFSYGYLPRSSYLDADSLFMTPMTQTMQLRPELTYLDKISDRQREAKNKSKDDAPSDEDDEEVDDKGRKVSSKPAPRQVQVQIKPEGGAAGRGNFGRDQASGRHDGSLFAPVRAEEGDAWFKLPYFDAGTEEASVLFGAMFPSNMDRLEVLTRSTDLLGSDDRFADA
jgi:DNA-directed RNA polymerase-3 subunit RPC5